MAKKKDLWKDAIKAPCAKHTKEELEELFYLILAAIEANPNWITMDDVAMGMQFCRTNLYVWWPANGSKNRAIHNALNTNKTKIKQRLRNKMANSTNPQDTKMLYQLCASPEESAALGMYIKSDQKITGDITVNLSLD